VSHITRQSLAAVLISIMLLSASSGSTASAVYGVEAPNWIIYDVTNDRILANQAMNQPVPLASLTKMITALLAVEHLSMEDEVTIVEEDQVGEASIWAEPDDTYTVETLLHGLLMRSGNDAAAALARAVGGSPDENDDDARSTFTALMNMQAQRLGMENTRFENPHGLDADNQYSSAYDLMLLTKETMKHSDLMDALGADVYSAEGFVFDHTNQLPDLYDGVIGGKTGWTTNAGLCLIQIVEKDGRTLIVVLLGSSFERWYEDAIDLLDYGWKLPGVPRPNHDFGPVQWNQG
jgi:serine-type D-Ala-D-Ala carboxypeptidase (penicillin-binding protein 5/6)